MTKQAYHIKVSGRVQGVGFRPFVSRLAHHYQLTGWVRNTSGLVELWVEGNRHELEAFVVDLLALAPPLASPHSLQISSQSCQHYLDFRIEESVQTLSTHGHIPPDYYVCQDCLLEMRSPEQRRYRYPFINCTQCGPRYSIIARMPYDRCNTTMQSFPLCAACQNEYENPLDRRYHAQPLACVDCGPTLSFVGKEFRVACTGEQGLAACIASLQQGLIVAVKGIGGYHLLCDATDAAVIARLRERKHRPAKPFAVLMPSLGRLSTDFIERYVQLSHAEQVCLTSPMRPIVLLNKRSDFMLPANIAPNMNELGVFLPYSPLHYLITEAFAKPLIATSANLSDEPVCISADEVEAQLSTVADVFLHHDRIILHQADDSIFRSIAGKMRPLRLARGTAPIEHQVSFSFKCPMLAVGADGKNTIALGVDERIIISPHIGQLGSLRSQQVFEACINDLQQLYAVTPEMIVCDAHPDYFSTLWAYRQGLPVKQVWHHHAHASALMGEHHEHGVAIVFAWDGTGYGEDGCAWGGETLLGEMGKWRRVGSIKPFYLLGGHQASREPWRTAVSVCWEQGIDWEASPVALSLVRSIWQQKINCPKSSSVGRLFDAAAALTGVCHYAHFEGQAAMQCEAIAQPTDEIIALPLLKNTAGVWISDWGNLITYLNNQSLSPGTRSSVFHASLATMLVEQAQMLRKTYAVNKVGLTGGVFQNRLLTEQVVAKLTLMGFDVLLHQVVPSNDGGISFGQLIDANASQK
ncbi:MAG: carbamoyltransferase HypF [Methylovulum sp.]